MSAVVPAHSARLRRKIELVLPVLLGAGRRLVDHPGARGLYRDYLVASHGVIRASVPLMETALARARELAADDPVAAGLAEYLERHADEEVGHDDWLLEDLEAIGGDREDALAEPPSAAVATLVGAPYYWILHYHPVAVMGYIALLEGYPPTMTDVDRWMTTTGYGREAFRTLIRHAELDPLHREEMDEALDAMPLTRAQDAVVGLTALHTVDAFARMLEELLAAA